MQLLCNTIFCSYTTTEATKSECIRAVAEVPREAEEEAVLRVVVDGINNNKEGVDEVHRCDEAMVLVEAVVATIEGALEARGRNQHGRNVTCVKQSRKLVYHPPMVLLLYQLP